jgi:CubicO group peptidase (beta-lactamase class C family)
MSMRHGLTALLIVILTCHATYAQAIDATRIDTFLTETLQAWQAPGMAVAIVHGDTVLYLKGHGLKDLSNKAPVTPDTLFPLASCSKSFITASLAALVDDGKLTWDDPVRKHIPYFHLADPSADALVSVRDLVTHRAGLSGHELLWYHAQATEKELVRKIALLKPQFPFRGAFHYQSLMFNAAGLTVAEASGTSWDNFVQKRFFEPLGMTTARCSTAGLDPMADRASPHRKSADGQLRVIDWYPLGRPNAAGSIVVSARDLAAWASFQLGGTYKGKRLVSARALGETHMPQNIIRLEGTTKTLNPETTQMSYGMGWVIHDYRGQLLVAHAGAIDGFRAQITLVPKSQLGIVILTNLHGTRMISAVSNSLVDFMLGLPFRDWNAFYGRIAREEEEGDRARRQAREAQRRSAMPPKLPLKAYVGSYHEPAYGTGQVRLNGEQLTWHWSTFHCTLDHLDGDQFIARSELLGDPLLIFRVDNGRVAGLTFVETAFQRQNH